MWTPGSRFSENWAGLKKGTGMQGEGKDAPSSGRLCRPKEGVGVELKVMEWAQLTTVFSSRTPARLPSIVSPKLTSFYRPQWEFFWGAQS